MDPDDQPDDDLPGSPLLLPPDDRLWRHPSELGSRAGRRASSSRSLWVVALAAGTAGALLSVAALGLTGALDEEVAERPAAPRATTVPSPVPALAATLGAAGSDVDEVVARVSPAVAHVGAEGPAGARRGSAVVIDTDGHLVTSNHVVAGAERLAVVLPDGTTLTAELVGGDADTDIAVVRVRRARLPVATLGHAGSLRVGERAIAIASGTAGLVTGPSVSVGVVSALGARLSDGTRSLHDLIRTDATVADGSAGGALLDAAGQVVGVVVHAGEGQTTAFATPVDVVRRVATQLIDTGTVTWVWLGIHGTDVDLATAARVGSAAGALVREVVPEGPAARAGLVAGDVIDEVEATEVGSMSGLVVALRRHVPGDDVEIGYVRDGVRHRTTVRVIARP